jgi:predicted TIM-barrel fold metal-dependent hydrolase
MVDLDFGAFDWDNHYYEAPDAFTRHLDPAFKKRGVQWATVNGKPRLVAGGRIWRFIPNPTWDPIARPGSLDEYFRGQRPRTAAARRGGSGDEVERAHLGEVFGALDRLGDHPEYQDRQARLLTLDQQGLAGCVLFPTQGVGFEEALIDDPAAVVATAHAFNEWLDEDWGFHHQDRLFGAPIISLVDPDRAVEELAHVVAKGARVICVRCAPVRTPTGNRSPGDPVFDPLWAAVVDAGLVVAFHAGDAGYNRFAADWGESAEMESFRQNPLKMVLGIFDRRPIFDTMAALVCHGVFDRHPGLRVASIESGSAWVLDLLHGFKKAYWKTPHLFGSDPVESFLGHVWVSPFYEEDIRALADLIDVGKVLMGSDWPHAEGLAEPTDYRYDLEKAGFEAEDIRRIMRDNGLELIGLAGA